MRNVIADLTKVFVVAAGLFAGMTGVQAQLADSADLKPGLAVCYIQGFVRYIDEIAGWESQRDCVPGEPLAELDSRVGKGKVLTSDWDNGVMAKITGFIHFEHAGFYSFAFESNDGVRLEIDGEMILEDPDVHADQYSDVGSMEVVEPGWYPLNITYFERKNTSTLRFFWSPPDVEGTMPLVPASALAH